MIRRSKTIVFVTSFILHPVSGGGAARVLAMVDYFRSNGFRVEVVMRPHQSDAYPVLETHFDRLWIYSPNKTPVQKRAETAWGSFLTTTLQRGIRLSKKILHRVRSIVSANYRNSYSAIDRNRNPQLDAFAGRVLQGVRPVAVIAECVWTARSLDLAPPNALRIINTHDVQHLRSPNAKEAGHQVDRLACTREEETLELNRADLLLAIQEREAEILKEMCPEKRVIVVEHAHKVSKVTRELTDGRSVLFVGNYYEPNIIGLKGFLSLAWPKVLAKVPDAKFLVCGKVCDAIDEEFQGVEFLGLVPSLEEYYQRAAVVVNPVAFGSGLKIKTVEALAYGKCLVSTDCGILGLPKPNEENPYCQVVPIEEMGDSVARLLDEIHTRREHEKFALQFAESRFSPDATYRQLTEIIRRVPVY